MPSPLTLALSALSVPLLAATYLAGAASTSAAGDSPAPAAVAPASVSTPAQGGDTVPCTTSGTPIDMPEGPLTWAPPALEDPEVITLTQERPFQRLDDSKDYVVRVDGGRLTLRPDQKAGVWGGDDVVWIGGEINAPGNQRPIKLDRQRGSVHLEGVHVTGGGMREGINLDQRYGASVTIENVLVDPVSGNQRGHHADVLQTWAGPGRLRIDRLEGTTDYQGIMIDTQGFGNAKVSGFDLRNVVLRHTGEGYQDVDRGYLVRRTDRSGGWPLKADNVVLVHPTKSKDRLVMGPGDWTGFDVARSAPSPLLGNPGKDYSPVGYAR